MPVIAPFRGLTYDPERIAIARAWVQRSSATPDDAWLSAEPRCGLRLDADAPSAAMWRADLLRAAVLRREEDPAFFVLRRGSADAPDQDRALGFFALVDLNEEALGRRLVEPAPGPVECAVMDPKRKVLRILRGATEELEPEVVLERDGEVVELFVVNDETTCARLITRMDDAALVQVGGPDAAHLGAEALAFFQPVTSLDDGAVAAAHVVTPTGGERGELLDAARVFFDVEPASEDAARAAVAEGAAALLDDEGAVILRLLSGAPREALQLGDVPADEAAADALVAGAVVALCGAVSGRRCRPIDEAVAEAGTRLFLLPSPRAEDDGRRPAGSVGFARSLPRGVVVL